VGFSTCDSIHLLTGDLRGKVTFAEKNCRICTKGRYFLKYRNGRFYVVLENEEERDSIIFFYKNEIDTKK